MKRNTQAIVQLAAEKSRLARQRVIAAIASIESQGTPINFNTISRSARVSKTFLYDPKHSDLAEQIRAFRQTNAQSVPNEPKNSNKSDTAKDAQFVRFKEHIKSLEDKVRALQEENELLYGKLSERSYA